MRQYLRIGLIAAGVTASACEPHELVAVDSPGGVYRPGEGCGLREEGGSACPTGAVLDFERPDADQALAVTNLTARRVTCHRSFCGTGALGVTATFTWPQGVPSTSPQVDRLGELRYRFDPPVDLLGKTIGYNVLVEPGNTLFNAQLAIVHGGRWRKLSDGPLPSQRGWSTIVGMVSPENALTALPATTTSVLVQEIVMQVYLSVPVRSGDRERWTGNIYIDDVGWR